MVVRVEGFRCGFWALGQHLRRLLVAGFLDEGQVESGRGVVSRLVGFRWIVGRGFGCYGISGHTTCAENSAVHYAERCKTPKMHSDARVNGMKTHNHTL